MKLSDVFYEAACRMSDYQNYEGDYSCCEVSAINHQASMEYDHLMSNRFDDFHSGQVRAAAKSVHWNMRDYRTFMLLMASEAVRV